jgi:hypothetical protein
MVKNRLIQHHEKYKELHGEDKIVLMTSSEHTKLHKRLRDNGKCKVPADTLQKISSAAHQRTDKYKENLWEYNLKKQHKKIVECFGIYITIMPGVLHHEQIAYNRKSGDILVSYDFRTYPVCTI